MLRRGPGPHVTQGFGVTKDPEETRSLIGLRSRLPLAPCITLATVTFSLRFLPFWGKRPDSGV